MSGWLYTLRERFSPRLSGGWQSYLAFSRFTQLDELITLDSIMCPSVISSLREEDWSHNTHQDFRLDLFRNLEYLQNRQPLDPVRHQLLAVIERPGPFDDAPDGFVHCGFDIMDSFVGNSTLTNCGPIPEAFEPSEVNRWGLIDDHDRVYQIRDKMRQLLPDDPHLGNCEVWSLARKLPDDRSAET